MLRILTAALAALAASACTIGLPSAVEAAPFEARMANAPFADGVYCGLEIDDEEGLVVRTADEDGENNCAAFGWQASRRVFVIADSKKEEPPIEFAPADLGGGLFLMQLPLSEEERGDKPFSFTLMAGMAQGNAIVVLPFPSDTKVAELAARHPGVSLSTYKTSSPFPQVPVAETDDDAAEPTPVPNPDVFYISAGSPADIRRLGRDVAIWTISEIARQAAEEDVAVERGIPTLVRDQPGHADHAPSAAQQRDIDALMRKLRALPPTP